MKVYETTSTRQSLCLLPAIHLALDTSTMVNADIVAVPDTPTINQPYWRSLKSK